MPVLPLSSTALPASVIPRDLVILMPPATGISAKCSVLLPTTRLSRRTSPSDSFEWIPSWPEPRTVLRSTRTPVAVTLIPVVELLSMCRSARTSLLP